MEYDIMKAETFIELSEECTASIVKSTASTLRMYCLHLKNVLPPS
jgi:hypothetical protein